MVELFEKELLSDERGSSKGNQLKWCRGGRWYKADYAGYEGLAEYTVSQLLAEEVPGGPEIIAYRTEEIHYKERTYLGCSSANFLPEGWQLVTLERLFYLAYHESLYRSVFRIDGVKERAVFLCEQVEQLTGLKEFGPYLRTLLTIDALFLNEDRHMHNIAVLEDEQKHYHLSPVFDNGASLLSDTTQDYPLSGDWVELMDRVSAKTISTSFDEQLDAVEELYGQPLKFSYGAAKLRRILEEEPYYPAELKERVGKLVLEKRRQYTYLFS